MKAVIVSVVVALVAIVAWFASSDESRPQVVVLIHSIQQEEEVTVSPVPAPLPQIALPVSHAASVASASVEQSRYKEYMSPAAVRAFKNRRDKILEDHWKTVNVPRVNQGLEPLEPPKITPTAEEIAAMISGFQAKAREIAQQVENGFDNNIGSVLWDLRDTGISVQQLDQKTVSLLNQLGQEKADKEAVFIRKQLEKGCPGSAGYMMDTVINQIAIGLEHPALMGYIGLYGDIRKIQETEWQYAAASTEQATRAVVHNLQRQRQPICGTFG